MVPPCGLWGRGLCRTLVLLILVSAPGGVSAQSSALSELSGTVVDALDEPVVNAIVTLWVWDRPTSHEVSTDRLGYFSFQGIIPGRYEVRVEAVGFHPQVMVGVGVRPGAQASVSVRLREGRPPVTVVDTTSSGSAAPDGQRWIEDLELRAPALTRELGEVLELATTMDARMGSLGLPSGLTTLRVQGVPVRSVAMGVGEQGNSNAVSASSLGLVRVSPPGPVHIAGIGAGGTVEVFNPALQPGEWEVWGSYSWAPLWEGRYEIGEGYTPSSFWAAGRTVFELVPDSARMVLGADFQHLERPRQALFAGRGGTLEDHDAVSTFALVDWNLGDGTVLDFGARLGAQAGAHGLSELVYPVSGSALKARDVILGGGMVTAVDRTTQVSFRAGFTHASRAAADSWPVEPGTPFLYSVSEGRAGGVGLASQAESARQGVFGSATLRHEAGVHTVEGGVELLRSGHDLAPFAGRTLWAGAGSPFRDGWSGMAEGYGAGGEPQTFAVSHFALFVRDAWLPLPGLKVMASGAWHREILPANRLQSDAAWSDLSGLPSADPAGSASGFAGHLGLDWIPGGAAPVRLTFNAGARVDEVDPWTLAEAMALDGTVTHERILSGGAGFDAFPEFPSGGAVVRSAPSLILFPSALDLPTSVYASVGASTQRLGWTFGLSGVFRRTDNLFRRFDLNRAVTPRGVTEAGLPIWGDLIQLGSLVVENPGSSRRFQEYDNVWTLLQDGWSQYAGVTVFTERRAAGFLQLSAWYTYSSTTDNLPGLATGRGELATPATIPDGDEWTEGTSDLHVPHRVGVAAAVPLQVLEGGWLRSRFRFDAGRRYTPGLRRGVDLDADGVAGNEPVLVPASGLEGAECLSAQRGAFAARNSCSLPTAPDLDLGLSLAVVKFGGGLVSLQVDVLNLLQVYETTVDPTMLVVNPNAPLGTDGTALFPDLRTFGGMGGEPFSTRDGRMIRIGINWGAVR